MGPHTQANFQEPTIVYNKNKIWMKSIYSQTSSIFYINLCIILSIYLPIYLSTFFWGYGKSVMVLVWWSKASCRRHVLLPLWMLERSSGLVKKITHMCWAISLLLTTSNFPENSAYVPFILWPIEKAWDILWQKYISFKIFSYWDLLISSTLWKK